MTPRPVGSLSHEEDDIDLDLLVELPDWSFLARPEDIAHRAAEAALRVAGLTGPIAITVLMTDDAAMADLNRAWRGKDRPTNVLSFPAAPLPGAPAAMARPMGDIVLASGVVAAEARAQGKTLENHVSHLIVHGVLHLAGHEHETDEAAAAMQSLEIKALAGLGIADPYERDEVRANQAELHPE